MFREPTENIQPTKMIPVSMNFCDGHGNIIHTSHCNFTLNGTSVDFGQCALVHNLSGLNIDYPNVSVPVPDVESFNKKLCNCATCVNKCNQRG
jgi:hypothetical protein